MTKLGEAVAIVMTMLVLGGILTAAALGYFDATEQRPCMIFEVCDR